jgi:23S rRNA pseudouridine1911/1915/1917 synthase
MRFIIKKAEVGKRLDKFLTEKLSNKTRSQIKKLIKNNLILVNDQPAKVHHFLKASDKIEIFKPAEEKVETKETPQIKLKPKIIFANKSFLVLEKPAGLLVHPTEKGETDTLVNWLITKYPKIKNVGEEKYREGIIHRLDKDVSGVMVAAKTKQAYFHLKDQFKKRLVKKEYTALVYGRLSQPEGEIDLPIGRNKEGQFVAHPRQGKFKFQEKDKVAKTKYKVLEYLKDYTRLKVQILTGRTHQIRAHLSAIGHPILGDQIYKPKKKFFHFLQRKIKVVDPGRIFLHSTKIGFNDLQNEWQEFKSPLPKKLTDFINEIKNK